MFSRDYGMIAGKFCKGAVVSFLCSRWLPFSIPPEVAHGLAIFALKNGLVPESGGQMPASLGIQVLNLRFRTPVGLAAGFDKNAEAVRALLSLGFGFVEVGTVTKKAQYGNKKPRVFRLSNKKAIINCLGFNNKGVQSLIKKVDTKELNNMVFGINVGMGRDCSDPPSEYASLVKDVYGFSSYIALNLSSPNTPGLRDLQRKAALSEILASVKNARYSADHAESVPILLKVSPDMSDEVKQDIVDEALKYKMNGLIVGNTSTDLSLLKMKVSPAIRGGLSGQPLFDLSTRVLAEIYSLTQGKIVLIGCGGVSNGSQALEKMKAGASLIQLYTAMVYGGFRTANRINAELAELLAHEGFTKVDQAIGANVQ